MGELTLEIADENVLEINKTTSVIELTQPAATSIEVAAVPVSSVIEVNQTGPSTPGKDGVDGLSAYEIAVLGGFAGTESEWLASLSQATDTNIAALVDSADSATKVSLDKRYMWAVKGDAELDNLLASLPAWSMGDPIRHVKVKPGSYTRTQAVKVPSGTVLDLYGVTLKLGTNVGDDVVRNADRVSGNMSIWILGGTLDGNVANQANTSSPNGGQSGVSIYNSHHVTIRDVTTRNTLRHGFDISTNTYANPENATCTNVTVVNCTATTFGDDGFSTHFASQVIFSNCIAYNGTGGLVANGASHGFEVDDGSVDVLLFGCRSFNNSRGRGFYIKSHSSMPYHSRFTLIGCEAYGNNLEGFGIQSEGTGTSSLSDVSVIGCWSHGNTGDGLRVTSASNISITDFAAEGGRHGIRLVGPLDANGAVALKNVVINGFRIKNTTHSSVMMAEGNTFEGVLFTNGVVSAPASEHGFYIGATGVTVESVRVVDPVLAAIRVRTEAKHITLRSIDIVNSKTVGIAIEGNCEDVTIDGAVFFAPFTGNTRPAIEFPATSRANRVSIRGVKVRTGWTRGVYVIAGAQLTDIAIQNNDFRGASTAGVSQAGTIAGDYLVSGNFGYSVLTSADTLTDGTNNKVYTSAEKTKLGGIAPSATANDTDTNLKSRANHTGSQASTTISDFTEAVQDVVGAFLKQGAGVSIVYNDAGNEVTISATGGGGSAPTWETLPAKSAGIIIETSGTYPARPTTRTDVSFTWIGTNPPANAVEGVDTWFHLAPEV